MALAHDDEAQNSAAAGGGPAPAASEPSDHEKLAEHFGLGFMGARFVPAATLGPGKTVVVTAQGDAVLTIGTDEVTVPIWGARYWFHKRVGLDLALGFNVASGTVDRQVPNPDPALSRSEDSSAPSTKAFVAHLDVPISLYSTGHFNFLLLPEFDIGLSGSTYEGFETSTTGEPLDLKLSGLLVGGGLRFGTELSLGFFDLPQISLQASFGLRVEYRKQKGRIGDAEMTISGTELGTTWYGSPWNMIAGNLGLIYCF